MECGSRCKSKRHALEINSVLTKGTLDEFKAYCRLCYAAPQVSDIYGRTSLQVAASCGKCDIIDWLLTEKNGDATQKDSESGWTALHRAAFYGQLAAFRLLVQVLNTIHIKLIHDKSSLRSFKCYTVKHKLHVHVMQFLFDI